MIFATQIVAVLALIATVAWRMGGTRRFEATKFVAATPQQLWDEVIEIPAIDGHTIDRHPLLPAHLVSYRTISSNPEIIEKVFDKSDGRREELSVEWMRVLEKVKAKKFVTRLERLNGWQTPHGSNSFRQVSFKPQNGGTLVHIVLEMEVASLGHWWQLRQHTAKSYDEIAQYFAARANSKGDRSGKRGGIRRAA